MLSLTYPPTFVQGPQRGGPLASNFFNPEKLICMGISKNRLASARGPPPKCPPKIHLDFWLRVVVNLEILTKIYLP